MQKVTFWSRDSLKEMLIISKMLYKCFLKVKITELSPNISLTETVPEVILYLLFI